MRSLFRALDDEGVRYLLISGQACVLYGASQFTEDVDLWVQPASSNLESFLRAMARVRAVVYKLTPPITLKYVRKGHGFHFRIGADLFLDMMGHPPRVGAFLAAFSRARKFKTDWGTLRVSAPEDLVLLKRTNRPGDYEAISNLVRLRVVEDKGGSVRTPVGPPEHVRRGGPRGLWPPSGGQAESVALRPPPCVPCSPSPRLPCQS